MVRSGWDDPVQGRGRGKPLPEGRGGDKLHHSKPLQPRGLVGLENSMI